LFIASSFPNFTRAIFQLLLLAAVFFRKTCKRVTAVFPGLRPGLAGLEAAIKARNEKAISLAIERILLGHALILGYDRSSTV